MPHERETHNQEVCFDDLPLGTHRIVKMVTAWPELPEKPPVVQYQIQRLEPGSSTDTHNVWCFVAQYWDLRKAQMEKAEMNVTVTMEVVG